MRSRRTINTYFKQRSVFFTFICLSRGMMDFWAHLEDNLHIHNSTYRRCCFIYVLVLLADTAALRQVVEGVEGDSVVLSCTHRSIKLEGRHLTVHWRHNDSRNVFDIIHGRVSVREQDPAYRSRARVDQENSQIFLNLRDLQISDRGTYLCFVPERSIFHNTELRVKERQKPKTALLQVGSHGTKRSLHLLIPLSGFILHFI